VNKDFHMTERHYREILR